LFLGSCRPVLGTGRHHVAVLDRSIPGPIEVWDVRWPRRRDDVGTITDHRNRVVGSVRFVREPEPDAKPASRWAWWRGLTDLFRPPPRRRACFFDRDGDAVCSVVQVWGGPRSDWAVLDPAGHEVSRVGVPYAFAADEWVGYLHHDALFHRSLLVDPTGSNLASIGRERRRRDPWTVVLPAKVDEQTRRVVLGYLTLCVDRYRVDDGIG
jgi:hypothetical protein